jgi:dTMP kinase
MANRRAGLFVTFEGVEGAGKSTQIGLLRAHLEQAGHSVCVTREPGGDVVAETVRRLLLENEMEPRAELLLFLAARAQNVERIIRPHVQSGGVVLCDRFIDSSVAYQGCARGIGTDIVRRLNAFAIDSVIPDLTILLDLPPALGLARQSDHNRMEAEDLAFHERVREGFLLEAQNNPERFCVLDATQEAAPIQAAIRERVQALIDARGIG